MRKSIRLIFVSLIILILFPNLITSSPADCIDNETKYVTKTNVLFLRLIDFNNNEFDRFPLDIPIYDGPCSLSKGEYWTSSVIHENNIVLHFQPPETPPGIAPGPSNFISRNFLITADQTLKRTHYQPNQQLEDMTLIEDHSGYRLYKNWTHIGISTIDGDVTLIDYMEENDQLIGFIPHSGILSQDGNFLYLLATFSYRTPFGNGSTIFDHVTKLIRTEIASLSTVSLNLVRDSRFSPTEDMYIDFRQTPNMQVVAPYSNDSIYVIEKFNVNTYEHSSMIYKIDINSNSTIMSEELEVDAMQGYDLEGMDILVSKEKEWYCLDQNLQKANSAPIITMDSSYIVQVIYEVNEDLTWTNILLLSIPITIILAFLTRQIITKIKHRKIMEELSSR